MDKTALVHQRRRAEWPIFGVPDLDRLRTNQQIAGDSDPTIALETLQFIDEQLGKYMDTALPVPEDEWIAEEMRKASRDSQGRVIHTRGVDVRGLLANAWFRARQQSAIMDIWLALTERGLLSPEGLEHPISWYTNDENVIKAAKVLKFFSGISSSMEGPYDFPNQQRTENTWFWLAIQIVRCGVKQTRMMIDLLKSTGALGSFDEDAFLEEYPHGVEWDHDPAAFSRATYPSMEGHSKKYYAEWLPHSLRGNPEAWKEGIRTGVQHFERIERYYYRYFSFSRKPGN